MPALHGFQIIHLTYQCHTLISAILSLWLSHISVRQITTITVFKVKIQAQFSQSLYTLGCVHPSKNQSKISLIRFDSCSFPGKPVTQFLIEASGKITVEFSEARIPYSILNCTWEHTEEMCNKEIIINCSYNHKWVSFLFQGL